MATVRFWLSVTPASKDAAQAAIDVAGLGADVEDAAWTPYPSPESVTLYWVGSVADESIVLALEAALDTVPDARHRRGPVRGRDPAMTEATLIGAFPLPNSGPDPLVIVTRNAALAAHYRDFGLGALPDDGSPGIVAPVAPAARKRK